MKELVITLVIVLALVLLVSVIGESGLDPLHANAKTSYKINGEVIYLSKDSNITLKKILYAEPITTGEAKELVQEVPREDALKIYWYLRGEEHPVSSTVEWMLSPLHTSNLESVYNQYEE